MRQVSTTSWTRSTITTVSSGSGGLGLTDAQLSRRRPHAGSSPSTCAHPPPRCCCRNSGRSSLRASGRRSSHGSNQCSVTDRARIGVKSPEKSAMLGHRWCQSAQRSGASLKQRTSFTPPLQFVATTSTRPGSSWSAASGIRSTTSWWNSPCVQCATEIVGAVAPVHLGQEGAEVEAACEQGDRRGVGHGDFVALRGTPGPSSRG